MKQGLKQGLEQGLDQGLKQGLEQGKIDTAKKMLEENIDINIISKVTGLTTEEIANLNSN